MEDEIFFNQSKYIKEMLKKFGLEDSKPTKTPMSTEIKLTKDDEADFVDSTKYQDMLGCCLTSWFAKKQTALAISTTEAEYISAKKACQQALWMKQALIDYDVCLDDVPIMCDNKGAIDLSKTPVQHSRTKHIETHHHFLRDNVQKGNISIEKVASEDNIADILTKPLKREVFNYLRLGLGMIELIMNLKANIADHLFDERYALLPRNMTSFKAKQPKKPPPKRTRNVGKCKDTQLSTSSSTESPPSDNRGLPSTKLSPRSYSRALPPDPIISKEQKETKGIFKNLGRALHKFEKMLKKGCR
ncbi:hypothetical protein Tco_0683083 [Tanacetum coccineum]|uniref:Copia protein n=1 Tax=Tanacetum coccineum TaxID=301880 RepID=A0ABQ4XT19_9ASTR